MENTEKTENRIRTGCTLLDLVVGGGQGLGFPVGKIVNIVGDKSSGKTFLACEIVAKNKHAYKKLLKHNYDDGENGFTFDTTSLYGFPMVDENTLRSHQVEEWDVNMHKFLSSIGDNDIGLYVMDSLDGLSNKDIEDRATARVKASEEDKDTKEKGTYGVMTPKFLSQEFFRTKTRVMEEKHTALLIISQVRENLEPFSFKKWSRSGGKALDFYAHTVLWLANVKTIYKKERAVGVIISAKTDKSKTPRPYRECQFIVYFDYGIDNIGSNLDFLFDLRTDAGNLIQENAQNIHWAGKDINLPNVKAYLETNKLLEEARKDKKGPLSLKGLMDWINANEAVKKKFDTEFGEALTRDELITKIENSPEMTKELEKRVIEKWEAIELAVRTDRKRKYE